MQLPLEPKLNPMWRENLPFLVTHTDQATSLPSTKTQPISQTQSIPQLQSHAPAELGESQATPQLEVKSQVESQVNAQVDAQAQIDAHLLQAKLQSGDNSQAHAELEAKLQATLQSLPSVANITQVTKVTENQTALNNMQAQDSHAPCVQQSVHDNQAAKPGTPTSANAKLESPFLQQGYNLYLIGLKDGRIYRLVQRKRKFELEPVAPNLVYFMMHWPELVLPHTLHSQNTAWCP